MSCQFVAPTSQCSIEQIETAWKVCSATVFSFCTPWDMKLDLGSPFSVRADPLAEYSWGCNPYERAVPVPIANSGTRPAPLLIDIANGDSSIYSQRSVVSTAHEGGRLDSDCERGMQTFGGETEYSSLRRSRRGKLTKHKSAVVRSKRRGHAACGPCCGCSRPSRFGASTP
jgi:hypothetical protein